MRELSVLKRRIYPRLSPDTNSPVGCLCLAKGRASCPARPARARTSGLCCHLPSAICHLPSATCHLPSPTASRGLDYAVCSPSPRTFALRLPPDKPSRRCPCRRLVLILAHVESESVLPQGTCTPQVRAHAGRTPVAQPGTLRRTGFALHFILGQTWRAAKCRLTIDDRPHR